MMLVSISILIRRMIQVISRNMPGDCLELNAMISNTSP